MTSPASIGGRRSFARADETQVAAGAAETVELGGTLGAGDAAAAPVRDAQPGSVHRHVRDRSTVRGERSTAHVARPCIVTGVQHALSPLAACRDATDQRRSVAMELKDLKKN
jgi:hypothetical protein